MITTKPSGYWYGLPKSLSWAYISLAIFMSGDGFELAFLSDHIVKMGFTLEQAALVSTYYGVSVALAAWASGVVAEVITPQKTMMIGCILWIVMHVLFMMFGVGLQSLPMMIIFYGIRGLAYPLFIYAFMLMLVQIVPKERLAAATGWFWAMFSLGIGTVGSLVPSITIPILGGNGTLWMAVIWVACGGLIAFFSLRNVEVDRSRVNLPMREKMTEMSRAVTILFNNKHMVYACIIRIINTLSLFGFAVIMPTIFTNNFGFTMSEWLALYSTFLSTTVFTNIFWGSMGNRIGWIRQVRWFGCLGMAVASLAFYYIPSYVGHNFYIAMIPAIVMGISISAFVPMTAVFPALEPRYKGASVSIYNLSAGLSNFAAPFIAHQLLPYIDVIGVVWVYAMLYILAWVLTFFIKVPQPGHTS
jgi:polyol permease family